MFLSVAVLVGVAWLTACGSTTPEDRETGGKAETTGSALISEATGGSSMNTQEIYEPGCEQFNSFSDLKMNADLLHDRAPCTVSTLGYYVAGDGGAATYRIVKSKPEGIFEKLSGDLWAVIEAEDSVTPQQFGAKGDGVANDATSLMRAGSFAATANVKLILPEAEYRTEIPVTFGGVKIFSQNAKISFHGMQKSTAAVYLESNTEIHGTLNIWTVDNQLYGSNHGERCALMFGKYENFTSVTDCYVESVVITGGTKHQNGVFITGDSHDITIDSILVPEGTFVNRAVLIHWGNAGDYILTQNPKTYTQKEGGKPTQHPHDITIGKIECHGLKQFEGLSDGKSAAISICAGYDIHVKEIVASDLCVAVSMTSGDAGFYFASGQEKDLTVRNIRFDKITVTDLQESAVYINGTSDYKVISPSGEQLTVDAYPELYVGEFYAQAAKGKKNLRGLNIHATGPVEIGKLTLKDFTDRALSVAYGCKKVSIAELNIENNGGPLIFCSTKAGKGINTDITIGKMCITGSGIFDSSAISVKDTEGFRIDSLTLEGGTYEYLLTLYASAKNVRLGKITCKKEQLKKAVILAAEPIASENTVSFGNLPDGVPQSFGASCVVSVDE